MQTLFEGKKILFAVLNWGLGHATRSVPVIQKLIDLGAEVHLAGDGDPLKFLSEVFPDLKIHNLPSYNIEYPSGWGGAWKTVFKAPEIIRSIKEETSIVEQIVIDFQIDAIFSDNRYGVYSDKVPSIFIGHQLRVLPPKGWRWGSGVILAWHKSFLKHFTEIWVPDFPGENNLTGVLSHNIVSSTPIRFIGPQSRFAYYSAKKEPTKDKIVAVLSGPEPQRTFLEEILIKQLKETGQPGLLIRGVVKEGEIYREGEVEIVNYLHGEKLFEAFQCATCVICRSGYSTLMDLSVMGKKVILIPTPGQTEQEYLAENLAKQRFAVVQKQSFIDLQKAMIDLDKICELPNLNFDMLLIDRELERLSRIIN